MFSHNAVDWVCMGLNTGQFTILPLDGFLNFEKLPVDDQMFIKSQYLDSQITSITFLSQFANIVLGTKQGEILMYDFMEQDEFMKQAFPGE